MGEEDLLLDRAFTAGQGACDRLPDQCRTARRGSDRDLDLSLHGLRHIANAGPHTDRSRSPVGPHAEVGQPHGRREQEFHRIHNPALVPRTARAVRQGLVAMGCLIEHNSVDGLMGGVEHAHCQAVGRPGLDRPRYVEQKGRLTPLVLSDREPIEPDLGHIVHGPEPQQVATAGVRVNRGREIAPVPGNAMVAGERVLDDPGHFRAFRLWPRAALPPLDAADVPRVRGQQPVVGIERDHRGHPGNSRGSRRRLAGIRRSGHSRHEEQPPGDQGRAAGD